MEALFLAIFVIGVVYYAASTVAALRDGDIETVKLIGRGSVRYSRSSEPIRYGCATLGHAAVVVALLGMSVMMIPEVPAGDWTAIAGLVLGALAFILRRRQQRLRIADVTSAADPHVQLAALPAATVARVARAALARPAAPEPAAGYREHGGPPVEALRAALQAAIAHERGRLALPPLLGLSATLSAAAALLVARELTGFTWTYSGVAALLGVHTLVSSLRFQRELASSIDALAHALSRVRPPD